MKQYNRIDSTRTWKANYQELAASCDKARAYCDILKALLYDSDTSGLKFVCRTDGEYSSNFGKMWYTARNGMVLSVDYDSQDISTYSGWPEALALYSTFGAAHNVATYRKLMEVAWSAARAAARAEVAA